LAVYINERLTENKTNKLRCIYFDKLKFTFEYDIKDVEENIAAFEKWNPKLKELLSALEKNNLSALDSVSDKMNTASRYIYFNQRSKSKLEELRRYFSKNIIKNIIKNEIKLEDLENNNFFFSIIYYCHPSKF